MDLRRIPVQPPQYEFIGKNTLLSIANQMQHYCEGREDTVGERFVGGNYVIEIVGSKGACLSFADKSVYMFILEGAISKPTAIHCYREVTHAVKGGKSDSKGQRLIQCSPQFNFGPDGTVFSKPITVRFRHSVNNLDNTTTELKVYRANTGESRWMDGGSDQCRVEGKWMEISLNQFGDLPESKQQPKKEAKCMQDTEMIRENLEWISRTITIHNETYCLDSIPGSTTALVQKEKEDVLAKLNFPGVAEDLRIACFFIRAAGYVACSKRQLLIDVNEVANDFTRMCHELCNTLDRQTKACTEVCQTLLTIYKQFSRGLEDTAAGKITQLAVTAVQMTEAFDSLNKTLDRLIAMLEKLLEEIMERLDTLKNAEQGNTENKAIAKPEPQPKDIFCLMAPEKNEQPKIPVTEADLKKQSTLPDMLFGAIEACMNDVSCIDDFEDEGEYERCLEEEARSNRIQFLKEAEKHNQARLKATLDLQACSPLLMGQTDDEKIGFALHGSVSCLKASSGIMVEASNFWCSMHGHCKQLTDEKMFEIMKVPVAKRLKVWNSAFFIEVGVRNYAKWVALEDVCTTSLSEIVDTETEVHCFLIENPTTMEAKKKLSELTQVLTTEIDEAVKTIQRRNVANQQEIAQLNR